MTRSVSIVERMRWMSSLAATGVVALMASVAFAVTGGHLEAFASSASTPSSPVTSAPAGSSAPLDPRIAQIAEQQPSRSVEAIVQFNPGVADSRARADTLRAGGTVTRELQIIHGLAAKMTAGEARVLAASSDVHSVSLNTLITPEGLPIFGPAVSSSQLQTTYARTLKATRLWQFGVTGTGVGVAVVDTGIAGDLADFRSTDGDSSRVVGSAVTNPGATTATDTYGHGTDVAGIIAGNGADRDSSDPLSGQYIGVAPNANLVSIKVSDEQGRASVLDVIYGIQFAVDHKADYNIRVINLSLDSTTPQSYKTDPLDAAVEAAWFHGIVVVTAAGNRGSAPDAVQYAPANDPYAITVGAVDENGSANPANSTIAPWSSRGTTQDGLQKPDVYAPGAHIVSVLAPDSAFAHMCAGCIVSRGYIRTGGTSMAAPMISGLVADLLQVHGDWTPDQVKGVLTSPSAWSTKAIPVVNAVRAALTLKPRSANQGIPSNTLLAGNGSIDYSRSSWSMSSWSHAEGPLRAGFAMSSWSCGTCSQTGSAGVDPSLSSWSLSSWSTLRPQG